MIPSEHLSRQRAGMNGIFDQYRAVDQNGGAASARILMRIGIRFSTARYSFRSSSSCLSAAVVSALRHVLAQLGGSVAIEQPQTAWCTSHGNIELMPKKQVLDFKPARPRVGWQT
jgi:hypothetical protein